MARPLNDSTYLYGIHDPGGEDIMAEAGISGWILFTEAIGCERTDMSGKDFSQWSDRGFGILVRLNNGYAPAGTIPSSDRYADFARRCSNYVQNSAGAHIWIIGNEMNHPIERPGIRLEGGKVVNPGEAITPGMYANCFRQCRAAIKRIPGHENDHVVVSGSAPWNANTVYDGNPTGDWCTYLTDILTILGPGNCDGISIHAYTHGSHPDLIHNDYKMNPPFQNRQYNFRVYRDFMAAIPLSMRALPVYLTETDQDDAWLDANNGWVQRAYGEIDAWNKLPGTQKIRAVLLYRWANHDQWCIEGKSGVISDFKQALTYKYSWNQLVTTPPVAAPIAFPETGKTAQGAFAAFHRKHGRDITGAPISEEYAHADTGLQTQDWERVVMEEFPASSGQIRLRSIGVELAELRKQLMALQQQINPPATESPQSKQRSTIRLPMPAITDITGTLPRNPGSLRPRPLAQIKYVVLNHTAVDPSVGADRLAAAHQKRWGAILYQYLITANGTILQTNSLEQTVDLTQPWPGQAVNIAVAGDFTARIPTAAQLAAAAQLSAWLLQELKLPIDAVQGAGELIPTQSPGAQWLQGQNWKGLLLARIANTQNPAGAPPRNGTAGHASLMLSNPTPDVARLNEQIQDLTRQLQMVAAEKNQLTQHVRSLTHAQQSSSPPPLAAEQARLLQQITMLNQTVADLRRQARAGAHTVPPPPLRDITDALPKHATNRYPTRTLDKITHLTIHHSAAPANVSVKTIAAYHVTTKNWPGIGYHFCIGPDGAIDQVNRLETISYHAGEANGYTVGICIEGDFRNGFIPTPKQLQSAGHLSAWLSQMLNVPVENIMGHKEYPNNPTECPGDEWADGQNWQGLLHAHARAVLAGNLLPTAKTIGHYVLFWQTADDWAKDDYTAAVNYVGRFRPTHGFSADDAKTAEYVTIVGETTGVLPAIEQMLRDAGCKVERLVGQDSADTKRILDDLALRGQRFQTLTM